MVRSIWIQSGENVKPGGEFLPKMIKFHYFPPPTFGLIDDIAGSVAAFSCQRASKS
jgi:hypothetical protein